MSDFALKFPAIVLEVVGLPAADLGRLLELEEGIVHAVGDPEEAVRRKVSGIKAVKRYLVGRSSSGGPNRPTT